MSKFTNLKQYNIKDATTYVKENWNENQKEGYFVSVKSFIGLTFAAMGVEGASAVFNFLSFSATSAVLGLIYGLSIESTYKITSMGTIISLLFIPIISNITDNVGVLDKGTFKKITIGFGFTSVLCIVLYNLPYTYFDFFLTDLFKHIAIMLGIKYASVYVYLAIYKIFGTKYGKYKPWVLFMGIPAVIFATIMVYIPYENMKPRELLLMVNILSTAMTVFSEPYTESYKKMRNLMTNNNKERTFIYSYIPIVSGVLSSCMTTYLALFATLAGYEINSIYLYRLVVPLYGVISVVTSCFIIWSEEKIAYIPKKIEQRLTFKETLNTVFRNKYLWIVNIAASFSALSTFDLILFNWMLLYSIREQWLIAILIGLTSFPVLPGNIITPYLVKKFDSRKLILTLKLTQISLVILHIPFIFVGNKMAVLILMTLMGMATTMARIPKNILEKTASAQALDYHQWKFGGKRVDQSSSYFQYITVPLAIALGYCSPYFMSLVGFVSDRDILYDSTICNSVFVFLVVLYVFELLGSTIPYFFFDLNNEKLEIIKKDLDERRKLAQEATLEKEAVSI